MKLLAVLLTSFALMGCAGKTVLLKNERGDLAKCEVTAGETMVTGVIIREMTLNNCIKQYEAAGYRRLSQ